MYHGLHLPHRLWSQHIPSVTTNTYISNVVNTLIFLICVLLCAYIRTAPRWPLHYPSCPLRMRLDYFPLSLVAAFAGIWGRAIVITSVATSSVYIMARFFDGWWKYNAYAQTIPYPPLGQWTFDTRQCDIFSMHIYSATKNVPAGTK